MFRQTHAKETGNKEKMVDGNPGTWIGMDVGGSHFSAALVHNGTVLPHSYRRVKADAFADVHSVVQQLADLLKAVTGLSEEPIKGVGVAMPGPFDYEHGICKIEGLDKYDGLFGLHMRQLLLDLVGDSSMSIRFENDASCFGLGAARLPDARKYKKLIAITLGTGLGACFIDNKRLVTTGPGVPPNGYLYNSPFKGGTAEDFISARWLLKVCSASDVGEMAVRALTDETVLEAFSEFGGNLQALLMPWVKKFGAEAIIMGGGIAGAYDLFSGSLDLGVPVILPGETEMVAIAGAATLVPETERPRIPARKTTQAPLPKKMDRKVAGGYTIFPAEPLGQGAISAGYRSLARWIVEQGGVRLEGFAGIDWRLVRNQLGTELKALGASVLWYDVSGFLKDPREMEKMVAPYLGTEGSVWGKKTDLTLADWYKDRLREWEPAPGDGLCILAGPGAGLSRWNAPIVYFDLPKNELQYRMRAGSAANLGRTDTSSFGEMYKRSYFVDWVVLNEHRRTMTDDIAVVVDGQHEEEPNWAFLPSLLGGMSAMARNLIRPRPWFEPGVWGGQWLKQHIPGLSRDEVNYAWSFELIAPENGVVFESDGWLLEIAFDWLMERQSNAVLGADAQQFGEAFPIRFDFLDTFDGGNLSIQCHPSRSYIREHFGEQITQDETYYILDSKPESVVYLGFREDIQPASFREALEESQRLQQSMDIEKYVQWLPAHKHDLFLIPNQTIHGSGINNLVLEISATPYIFTFKMYDWMRLDLEGMARPINIKHAFHNLDFSRKGRVVEQELMSKPVVSKQEPGMTLETLPTHPEHFYGIERITLTGSTHVLTEGKCHLLMVVEGEKVTVETEEGRRYVQHYAETFLIPAQAKSYTLINEDPSPVILIKAFVKRNQNHI